MKNINPFKRFKDKREEKQREIERQRELERIEKEKEEAKKKKAMNIMLAFMTVMISAVIWPILLPISLLAIWFFTKKKPNKKFEKYAKNAAVASVLGIFIFFGVMNLDESEELADELDSIETVADVEAEKADKDKQLEEKLRLEKEQEEKEQKEKEQKEKEQKERKEQEDKEKAERERVEKELAEANPNKSKDTEAPNEPVEIAEGEEDAIVNDGIPFFSNEDITSTEVYHLNGPLDSLGRVTAANAVVGVEIMPAEERGSIGHHEPTGWNQASYANIGSGGWLYNRSHLIGHQLTGNDNFNNLMTGTRWFNIKMLEYENFIANYIELTENHVRYRVTPVFEGDNLVASGAYMEGFSIEDNGEGLMFNIYIPNIQPGVEINYANGSSIGPAGPSQEGEITQYNPGGGSGGNSGSNSSSEPTTPAATPAPKPAPAPEPTPQPSPGVPPEGDLTSVDTNGNGKVTIQEAKDAGFSMPIYKDHWLYKYMDDRDGDGMVGE